MAKREEKTDLPKTFGYYPKAEARSLQDLLLRGGVGGLLRLDKEFARRHKAATGVNPALRRRSTFKDTPSGWFVQVARTDVERARDLIAGTQFDPAIAFAPQGNDPAGENGEPAFFTDPEWCPACEVEVPPRTPVCPTCGGETIGILLRDRSGRGDTPLWAVVLGGLILTALVLARILR